MITWGKREFSGWLDVACAACVRFRFAMVRVIWLLHNEQIDSERPAALTFQKFVPKLVPVHHLLPRLLPNTQFLMAAPARSLLKVNWDFFSAS